MASTNNSRTEIVTVVGIFIAVFAFNALGLGSLEFFRHTEADRALIGWEMHQRGDYLVPHLLGSVLLTKPPLFYWLIAFCVWFTHSTAEWAFRLPSVTAAAALAATQYVIFRRVNRDRNLALFAAFVVASSGAFLVLGSVCEIDMVYAFLNTLALYLLFLGFEFRNSRTIILSYLVLALAFLTKGPPSIAFFGIAGFVLLVLDIRRNAMTGFLVRNKIGAHLLGVLVASLIIGLWLVPLANHVGWAELKHQFQVEIVNRVFDESTRGRGWLYYPVDIVRAFLPWSLVVIGGCVYGYRKRQWFSISGSPFFIFCLTTSLFSVLLLSFAEGKAGRYAFPVYPLLASVIAAFVWSLPRRKVLIVGVLILLGVYKIGYLAIYVPKRNEIFSVRPMAQEIDRTVPPVEPIYTVELFERWVSFYLKQRGRETFRLTPTLQQELITQNKPISLLLNSRHEAWRLKQLGDSITTRALNGEKDKLVLVTVPATALSRLTLQSEFPVDYSPIPPDYFVPEEMNSGDSEIRGTLNRHQD